MTSNILRLAGTVPAIKYGGLELFPAAECARPSGWLDLATAPALAAKVIHALDAALNIDPTAAYLEGAFTERPRRGECAGDVWDIEIGADGQAWTGTLSGAVNGPYLGTVRILPRNDQDAAKLIKCSPLIEAAALYWLDCNRYGNAYPWAAHVSLSPGSFGIAIDAANPRPK